MKRLLPIAAALAALTTASMANRLAVPVIVGGEQDYDACGSGGTVEGLNPRGDGFLAVKAGPGVNFERIDKLYNGMQLYICGEQGDWFAIVYSQTGSWSERCNGRGQCHTPVHAALDGSTAAGSARSLDEFFGPARALRICLKSTDASAQSLYAARFGAR